MRLSPDEIQYIAKKIIRRLTTEDKLQVDSAERVATAIEKVIADELSVEDRLNQEVRDLLMQHASELEQSNVTYAEVFKMLKKKMAREKGIVL